MRLFRNILTSVLILTSLLQAGAQERKGFIGRTLDKIVAPSRELDPNAVYQPEPRWTFALTGDLRKAEVSQGQKFRLPSAVLGPDDEMIISWTPVSFSSLLEADVNKAVGIQAGYGNLAIALSNTFRGKGTENVFSFDYLSAGHALQVQFFNLSNLVNYQMIYSTEDEWNYREEDGFTEEPGNMRALIVDAFYAFNRRSFAYSAAYKGNLFQKKSAGSWMFGAKVILGEYNIAPSEYIAGMTGGQARQTSAQVSFGGGYSYNLVPYHRQPYAQRDKGLRNLTVNLTLIPMVTLFNQFTSTAYQENYDTNVYEQTDKDVMNGKLLINYVARLGIGYSFDLFTLNLSASNDNFSYKGTSNFYFMGYEDNNVETGGRFSRWMISLRLGKRF